VSRDARGTPVNVYFRCTVRPGFDDQPFSPGLGSTASHRESVCCRIFWAFDLLPAADGRIIDPTKTVDRGATREPAPFQFHLRVRHPDVERIVEAESAEADLRLKEWEY
jgi:hypothetical protein